MRITLPLIALAALATPAVAAPEADTVTVKIAYADLDLTRAEDRAELEKRVEARLRSACMVKDRPAYTIRPMVDEECFEDARATALAEVERVAAAQARSGRSVAAN